jgi:hypothetical protein
MIKATILSRQKPRRINPAISVRALAAREPGQAQGERGDVVLVLQQRVSNELVWGFPVSRGFFPRLAFDR